MFTRIASAAALAVMLPALPAAADNHGVSMDTVLGTTIAEVTASLTEKGYEVRKTEMEDGKIEVYFVGHDRMGEVYVSTETGKPTKIEMK